MPLFRAAKVLPVVRGGGLAQPGMAAAESRLAAGDWVHIFPEGTRSPDGVSLGAVRKGVGRLVASVPEEAPPPLVVPFVHRGMEGVLPRGAVLPATGQKVGVRDEVQRGGECCKDEYYGSEVEEHRERVAAEAGWLRGCAGGLICSRAVRRHNCPHLLANTHITCSMDANVSGLSLRLTGLLLVIPYTCTD